MENTTLFSKEQICKMSLSDNRKIRLMAMKAAKGREDIPIDFIQYALYDNFEDVRFAAYFAQIGRKDASIDITFTGLSKKFWPKNYNRDNFFQMLHQTQERVAELEYLIALESEE